MHITVIYLFLFGAICALGETLLYRNAFLKLAMELFDN